MKPLNPYYKLDETGFIGTQVKRTKAEIKEADEIMLQFIQAAKVGKPFSLPLKSKSNLKKKK